LPSRWANSSPPTKRHLNRRDSTRTGRKNPGLQATQRLPSGERPPPGTMPWTCGWCVSAEPQVCSTSVAPICAPRCLGSAAMVAGSGPPGRTASRTSRPCSSTRSRDGRGQREDHVEVIHRQQDQPGVPPANAGRHCSGTSGNAGYGMSCRACIGAGSPRQRSTCPPSAALRHCSMAVMTLSWPRLRCAALGSAPSRPVGAEDVGHLQGSGAHGTTSYGVLSCSKGTDHFAQDVSGHVVYMAVVSSFLCPSKTWITRMSTFCSNKCVAKEWRSVCIDTRLSMCAASAARWMARLSWRVAQRLDRDSAREQPASIAASCPGHGPHATTRAGVAAGSAKAWRSGPCCLCPVPREASCVGCRCRRP
jgi:hypothetical protein